VLPLGSMLFWALLRTIRIARRISAGSSDRIASRILCFMSCCWLLPVDDAFNDTPQEKIWGCQVRGPRGPCNWRPSSNPFSWEKETCCRPCHPIPVGWTAILLEPQITSEREFVQYFCYRCAQEFGLSKSSQSSFGKKNGPMILSPIIPHHTFRLQTCWFQLVSAIAGSGPTSSEHCANLHSRLT